MTQCERLKKWLFEHGEIDPLTGRPRFAGWFTPYAQQVTSWR